MSESFGQVLGAARKRAGLSQRDMEALRRYLGCGPIVSNVLRIISARVPCQMSVLSPMPDPPMPIQ